MRASELAARGTPVQAAIRELEQLRGQTQTFAILNHLRFAVRGGRVPAWVKTVATVLGLTAIIRTKDDGRVDKDATVGIQLGLNT